MEKDIRTKRGKLDELTGIFSIKDGNKTTSIKMLLDGLHLSYTVGEGITEEIHIKFQKDKLQTA